MMKYWFRKLLILSLAFALLLVGCTPAVVTDAPVASDPPTAEASMPLATDTPAVTDTPAETNAAETWTLYTPASTSSIPVLMAAQQMGNVNVTLYTSQEQANTLFARGETPMLVTGLSVGIDLFRNEIPLQMVNSYVSGLSYMVTYGQPAASFADLKGQQVYVPFAGSPIEEVSQYLAAQEGLTWGKDIIPVYSPFDSSIALLKEGKAGAVILPEPSVSLVETQEGVQVAFSLADLWNQYRPDDQGYPQVGAFVNPTWAKEHADQVAAFNTALGAAIAQIEADPAAAVAAVKTNYPKLPEAILQKALGRTHYTLLTGADMRQCVETYYQVIGKALDEKFEQFYYLPQE